VKIYFVHQGLLSFVKKDLEILKEKHQVKAVNNFNATLLKIPANFLGVLWCDVVFCWFGSPRFIFPIVFGRLLRRKVVIVAGGYDVAGLPEIGYGNMRGGVIAWIEKQLFKLPHNIICISESNRKEAVHNAGIPPGKITMIRHGFHARKEPEEEKEAIVITVGRVSKGNLFRKGLLRFIEAAKSQPDVPFYIIGFVDEAAKERLGAVLPPNLTLTGYVCDEELENYLNRSKVYVQASMHEGFGCSVAEAMLHGCVPVVSNCFALPEVVGDAGHVFQCQNLEDMREKIKLALSDDGTMAKKARKRVAGTFPFEQRKRALLNFIDALQGG
jgi:glycosyltransferase involved in cell wall biosynthesis